MLIYEVTHQLQAELDSVKQQHAQQLKVENERQAALKDRIKDMEQVVVQKDIMITACNIEI
jgi:uncharacterized protein involved in exopolysaccharide biosynthesis